MNKQEINKRFLDFQQSTKFGKLPKGFLELARTALMFSNPAQTKIPISEFKEICSKSEFTLYDLGYVLHAMEIRTALDMGMELDEYCDYMVMIEETVKEWRAIVAPEQERLQKELEEYQAKQAEVVETKKGKTISLVKSEIPQ